MVDDTTPAGMLSIQDLTEYLASRLGEDHAVICVWKENGEIKDAWCVCINDDLERLMNDTIRKIMKGNDE